MLAFIVQKLVPALVIGVSLVAPARAVLIFGLEHTPVGNAALHVANGTLVVSNIGPSGNDGVFVTLPPGLALWRAQLEPLGSASSTADGSFLQLNGIGMINGIAHQVVTKLRATDVGAQISFQFDLSAVSTGSVLANYFSNGTLLSTETVQNHTAAVWTAPAWSTSGDVTVPPEGASTRELTGLSWWMLLHRTALPFLLI
jgi:hypothetical protein